MNRTLILDFIVFYKMSQLLWNWGCMKWPPYKTYMKSPHSRSIQVELGKVEGFWSTLQLLQQALVKYLNVEQQAHWLLMWRETNQLCHVIMMWLYQIELETISLRHIEFHDRNLYLHFCYDKGKVRYALCLTFNISLGNNVVTILHNKMYVLNECTISKWKMLTSNFIIKSCTII